MKPVCRIFKTPDEIAQYFAGDLSEKINRAARKGRMMNIALSGGSTPKILFSELAAKYGKSTSWQNVRLFWADERCVPPDDPESNFGMTRKLLIDSIDIPGDNVHRMRGEDDPEPEAERYSREIMENVPSRKSIPVFDIIILGMGDDGHTASIFPGNEKLFSSDKICDTAIHPLTKQKRITLTGKVINNAKEIFFLVTGIKKSPVISKIFSKSENSAMFPASYVNSKSGRTVWLIDEEAANNFE